MGLVKILKELFTNRNRHHNARDFVEVLRTDDKTLANEVRKKLEKFKIPVYELDHQASSDSSSGKILLRIPKKYLGKANEILK